MFDSAVQNVFVERGFNMLVRSFLQVADPRATVELEFDPSGAIGTVSERHALAGGYFSSRAYGTYLTTDA